MLELPWTVRLRKPGNGECITLGGSLTTERRRAVGMLNGVREYLSVAADFATFRSSLFYTAHLCQDAELAVLCSPQGQGEGLAAARRRAALRSGRAVRFFLHASFTQKNKSIDGRAGDNCLCNLYNSLFNSNSMLSELNN